MLDLRPTAYDHADAVRLTAEVQAFYRELYGDEDLTPLDPAQFAGPAGYFVIGYVDGEAVACGGWRARSAADDDLLRDGDVEIKRMYVVAAHRGRGHARAVLRELECSALAAGRRRAVLETGIPQPEAISLYLAAGYTVMPNFGIYRDEPDSRCFAKMLPAPDPASR